MEYYIVYEYDDYDSVYVFETLFRSYEEALEAVREIVEKADRGYMESDTPERRKQADEPSGAPVGDIGSNDRTFWIRKVKTQRLFTAGRCWYCCEKNKELDDTGMCAPCAAE